MNSKASFDLLDTLAKCIVIFSFVGQQTMAAEGPDHYNGDLGNLEEARNGQSCVHPFGIIRGCLFYWLQVLGEGGINISISMAYHIPVFLVI